MKHHYLLIGMLLLCHQGMSQQMDALASAHGRPVVQHNYKADSQSLKKSLEALEKFYKVSIAYKDKLVENKLVPVLSNKGKTVEESLDVLLKGTNLQYEKAGEGFYVLFQKKETSLLNSAVLKPEALLASEKAGDDFISPGQLTFAEDDALDITVSGSVTDESGQPFPGANVVVKGTSTGTSTNREGQYTLTVPDENSILVFSFVGYRTQEVAVGGRTVIDVTMEPDAQSLEEVVVTALGIERTAKSLGYATTKVDASQITENRTPNMMNALQGKIAGVNISALGSGPGGTSKIRIRGQSSITGQNNPLIVINGTPIDNTNFGNKAGNVGDDSSVGTDGTGARFDGGDGLSSINPDDIESMQVLKGATAAALYGSRAKDGVIMITTKSRGGAKGIGVTYNMNYTNETPLDFTDYQYEYGQGEYGAGPASPGAGPNPTSGQWSFGPRIEPGMTQVLFDGVVVPYVAQRNIIRDFYRNGQNLTNTVSLAANNDRGGMNVSFANMTSKGITPNNDYERRTANLGFGYDLSDKLTIQGNVNYSFEENTNPPVTSDQDNSIPTSLLAMANTMPLNVLRDNAFNPGGGEYLYSRFTNRTNPYWVLEKVKANIRRDRIFGNFSAKYDFTDWLSVMVRGATDFWARDSDYIGSPTGKANVNGGSVFSNSNPGAYNGVYTQEARRFRETNVDFLVTAAESFGDFGVNVSVGGNQMRRRMDLNFAQVTDFVVQDVYTIQNGVQKNPRYDLTERGVNSLYGTAEVSYKEFLYLNATARNDWFSTLSPENRSILYPSVSLSYVFSESFASLPTWLNFGKFRAAYASVGSDTDVPEYANLLFYGVNALPFSGQAVGNFGLTVPNANLRPMTVEETELGLELKMFDSRVNLDFAVYRKLTTDQIVNAQISDASGFTGTRINSGKSENKGVELMLNLVPVSTNNFQWDFTFTGAYNITKVLSLLTETPGENITVGNHVFNGFIQQIVGEEMGQIVGYGFRRDDGSTNPANKGKIIYGGNGLPLRTQTLIPFGSALPKWVGGFMNSFLYKGISASFLIDFKLGGKLLSGTNFNALRHGLSKETLVGREGGTVGPNGADPGAVVGEGVNQAGEPNTVAAKNQEYFSVVRGSQIIEPVIYDAGYWKLRQITIGYDMTKFFPTDSPIKGLRLSLVANNVLMLKKWADNIDPESISYASDNITGLESPSVPPTRSIGFNLNVKF